MTLCKCVAMATSLGLTRLGWATQAWSWYDHQVQTLWHVLSVCAIWSHDLDLWPLMPNLGYMTRSKCWTHLTTFKFISVWTTGICCHKAQISWSSC